ncbi:MAG: hypothetical protein EBY24_13705 [Betaproteobacteria bacterium]|nr:hypothetical protein [Betaproteobacteria bacterium]
MKLTLATAVALLIAFAAYLAFGPRPANVKIQSQWQANRYVLEKYLRSNQSSGNRGPQVVLVGSSLAERLGFDDLDGCVYNMALSGESMLTGLEAIVKSGHQPKQVYVEINVLGRKANGPLVEKAGGFLPRVSALFHTENMPINLVFSAFASGRKGPSVDSIEPGIFQAALQSKRGIYAQPLPEATLQISLSELKNAIAILEKRGTQIGFFEMPVNPELENSVQATQIRTAFRKAFPEAPIIGVDELGKGQAIHTIDGIHLDPKEAAGVSSNLRTAIGLKCSAKQKPI